MVIPLHHAARRVRVQGEEHRGFQPLPPAGKPEEGVDVLRPELQSLAVPRRDQVLPGERDGVIRLESAAEPEILDAVGLLGTAPEFPGRLPQRDRNPGVGLELLQVRLARAVGIRLGERELGVEVEQRRCRRRRRGETADQPAQARRLEVKRGVDAADQIGRGLEAERGPVEGALLPLVHPDQVDRADVSQLVAGRESQDRRGGNGKEALLLEPRGDLPRSATEQRVGIEEGDLAEVVGDGVVHPRSSRLPPSRSCSLPSRICSAPRLRVERSPAPVEL